ncbi:MAG: hypothetical protein HOE69_06880, partial [Euryarchaeota archaeon]|nr:hypothetical protein [Euryarchaeota archaeon]
LEEVVEDVEVEEVVVEPDPMLDEVAEGTPLYQLGDSEQLYVHDPPKNINILDNSTRKVSNSINLIYGLMMFGLTISILNNGFDMRINFGIIYDFISERFINSYGGMNDIQVASLAGLLSLLFFFSALMYISGHQFIAALTAKCAVVSSIVIRLLAYLFENNFGGVDIFGDLILDLMFLIPFSLSIWVPSMLKTSLSNENLIDADVFSSPMEPISGTDLGEYFTINALSGNVEGDEMSEFQVTKPKRPSRRGRVVFFYEGFFLIWATILWPALIYTLIALASLDFRNSQGLPADMTSNSITGQGLLALLFVGAVVCTYAVSKYDREARDGPIYAKSKAAYHEQMDQYLGLKNAYYELQAKKLEVQADMLPGHNEGN